jgi:cadmium resistance transport/sequestration family protein
MEVIITSIIAFASTNVDDIIILMLFFANKEYKTRQVVIGQYLGITALIAISLIGSLIGLLIDSKYIGLLGLLPVYLGIRGFIQIIRSRKVNGQEGAGISTGKSNKILSVAAVTLANGGDNIGIYIPLLATLLIHEKAIMISIFLLMVAAWCFVAQYLSKHRTIARTIDKYGHIVTPIVLILLGIYILYKSGTFNLI